MTAATPGRSDATVAPAGAIRRQDDMIDATDNDPRRPALAGFLGRTVADYVQPIAQHRLHPERLLLRAADGIWFLWTGEGAAAAAVEIPAATAAWLLVQPALRLLPAPHVWLHPADLPLLPVDARSGRPGQASESIFD